MKTELRRLVMGMVVGFGIAALLPTGCVPGAGASAPAKRPPVVVNG